MFFWRENLKLILIAAVAGAVVSSLTGLALRSFASDDLDKDEGSENIIASIPLNSKTRQTTITTTADITPTPRVLRASNSKAPTAIAINTATGIFDSEETAQTSEKEKKTETTTGSKVVAPEANCSFNDDSSVSQKSIIFNEINWAGSVDNSNAEWIELKNISDGDLDISGYEIIDLKEQIQIKIPNGTILPKNALYLLKRGEDTLSGVSAPTYTGALSNSSEGLRLFNDKCTLEDEALADPSWPAGNSKERLTMERESDLDWHSSEEEGGTPTKTNSKGQAPEADLEPEPDQGPEVNSEEQDPNQGVFEPDPAPPPEEEEPSNETSSGCESGQIDINSATLEELDEIIGVGPSIGQKIIDARPFSSLDELDDKVSGIGESRLADIIAEGKACVE